MRARAFWGWSLAGIIAAGMLSRVVHTGWVVLDKYLGDALYAAMVYGLFRLWSRSAAVVVWAAVTMIAIECFQLTMVPAHMLASGHTLVRICARLLGTEFSLRDLLAYGVGIGGVYLVDSVRAEG